MNKFLSALSILIVTCPVFASEITSPVISPVPGGIAVVNLGTNFKHSDIVRFLKQRVMVRKVMQQWQAIVGLPLTLKPGTHQISIESKKATHYINFSVRDKKYKTTHITIKNKRMVEPTKKDIERYYREKPLIIKALKTWTEEDNVQTRFSLPAKGRFSSPFGLRRIYNGQKRIRRHTGMDIAAPVGTAITSPARGKVIRIGNYFFTGNTVFIDHGQGLITMYCHLSKVDVKTGQFLKQHEKIGNMGMTGRVTGPHLHWVVSLNNTKVDPNLFLQ